MEPRKDRIPGADAVAKAEGSTVGCDIASVPLARRGRRTWHVEKLFAREPGDPRSVQWGSLAGPRLEGEEP
jgi:hypothetical protein